MSVARRRGNQRDESARWRWGGVLIRMICRADLAAGFAAARL
jgi:hypothetical protein